MEIKVYGTNDCPYCKSLKKYLKVLRIPFNFIDIDLKENEKEYIEITNIVQSYNIPLIKINEDFMVPEKDFDSIPGAIKKIFGKYFKK